MTDTEQAIWKQIESMAWEYIVTSNDEQDCFVRALANDDDMEKAHRLVTLLYSVSSDDVWMRQDGQYLFRKDGKPQMRVEFEGDDFAELVVFPICDIGFAVDPARLNRYTEDVYKELRTVQNRLDSMNKTRLRLLNRWGTNSRWFE
jgi:hypothetical protein